MTNTLKIARSLHRITIPKLLIIALLLSLLALNSSAGTSVTDGSTPLGLAKGTPAGTYALSGFDNINPYNGSLNFRLPLLKVGGRGSAQYTMMLAMELHWRVRKEQHSQTHQLNYIPSPNWWSDLDPGYGPGVLEGRLTGINNQFSCPDRVSSLTRLTFISPDGTEYELRDQTSGGKPDENLYQGEVDEWGQVIYCDYFGTPYNRGRVFVSGDGSAMTFISDSDIHDYEQEWQVMIRPSGHLLLRDGTCYRILGGLVQWIRDRNGNMLNFHYDIYNRVDTITDSLNRQITITYAVVTCNGQSANAYDEIKYRGYTGTYHSIKVWYDCLGNLQRSDFGPGYSTYAELFPNLYGAPTTPFNPRTTASVELPNGKTFTFRYNRYGELSRVTLPTGGAYQYNYEAGTIGGNPSGANGEYVYRRVVRRNVYTDANSLASLEGYMTYSKPGAVDGDNSVNCQVDHYSSGNQSPLATEKHYYYNTPTASFLQEPTAYPAWKDGKELKTQFLNGTPVLREAVNEWEQGVPQHPQWWTGSAALAPPNNPRLSSVTTTLEDSSPNKTSKQGYGYDQYNNKTDVREYDFGSSTPSRHTVTTFVTNQVNGTDYTAFNINSPADSIHIRDLPLTVSVRDGSDIERALTTIEYDNYTNDAVNHFHAPLVSRSSAVGADLPICGMDLPRFDTARIARGNVTATTKWVNTGGQVVSYQQYDIAGNALVSIDPRAKRTTFGYSDNFGSSDSGDPATGNVAPPELSSASKSSYGFVTQATNALNHTVYTKYDYYLGRAVCSKDPNLVIARGYYELAANTLNRPIRLTEAAGTAIERQTTFSYFEPTLGGSVTTAGDLRTEGDGLLKTEEVYDGLGRTTETRKYETSSSYITSTQTYDGMGRARRSSNPYRTTGDATYGYSEPTYDALSRVTDVITYDGLGNPTGTVHTDYNNNEVTVTDQAGKKRKSVTDGLGRLVQVNEDPTGSLNYLTTYSYDALDDLTTVTQQSGSTTQTRRFAYDSLSRLIFAANPEQITSSGLSYNSQNWAVKYEYDAASNLIAKTDSRGSSPSLLVKISYSYDDLNRVLTRSYTNPPAATPNVTYAYDTVSPNGIGRLASVAASAVSTSVYTAYDALGRVTGYKQQTGQDYPMTYEYDLAGNMKREVYPSLKAVITEYDDAGRIAGVKKEGAGYYAGANSTDATNRIQYTAHGAVTAMKLGNGKWEHAFFNSRLQPYEIGMGANSGASDLLKLEHTYSNSNPAVHDNNGNMLTQKITAPKTGGGNLVLTQTYTYDALNRLSGASENGSPTWSQTYDYDRWGNRAVRNTSSYIPTPVLTPQSANSTDFSAFNQNTNRIALGGFGYDNTGNLTSEPNTVSGTDSMIYDAENRQTSYTKPGATTSYSYDGDGHRVKRTDPDNTTTVFVYNVGGQLIAEYTTGTPSGGGTSYLTSDHLGSTRVVSSAADGGGNVTVKARYDYLPYGEEIGSDRGSRSLVTGYVTSDKTRQKFTQKERDNESGLDYFLARYYSSAQGRFTSPDEFTGGPDELYDFAASASDNPTFYADLHEPQSFNKYQYCYNNPLAYVDPNGHQSRTREPRVQIQVHRTTYAVQGKTAAEAMNNARTTNTHPGGLPGLTTWNYQFTARETYSAPTRSGSEYTSEGKVTGVDVKADITVDTPRWEGAANAPQEEQKQWNDYTQKLNEHEQGHVEIARQGAPEVPRAIAGATVTGTDRTPRGAQAKARENLHREESRRFTGADNRIKQRSEDYDKRTDHGRKPQ